MRILKVSLFNLNSLKGAHSVDFDAEPLASAGLFAITGATGAGKSTLLDAITLAPGSVVADVGAGSGYMTVKMAKRVGPTGKVYANDIQPQMLTILRQRLDKEKVANVDLVLGTMDDPKLPANTLDLILMVDVYHEFAQPQPMLRKLRDSLKTGGRLVLLEYRKEDPSIPIRPDHKMSVAEAKMEVEAEGFTLAKVDERLPRQHILVFTKN